MLKRVFGVILTFVLVATLSSAHAQTYPSRQITFVVGFAPGGFIDVIARLVAQNLSQKFGQPVVVENRAGTGGNLAHRRVATAEPDGYTVLAATTSIAINESLYPNRGYTADFADQAWVNPFHIVRVMADLSNIKRSAPPHREDDPNCISRSMTMGGIPRC